MPGVDWIPGVSHLKAGLQFATGDAEGASKTMNNFHKECPVISQITSVVQIISGDKEGAKETQLRCLGTLNNLANGIPVVGHLKAPVHLVFGDTEGAKEAFNAATRSTVVIGSGAAAALATGGVGAIPAGVAAGFSYDAAATAITNEDQGSIAAIKNAIENPSAGSIFDACAVPVGDGMAGYSGGRLVSKRVTLNNLEALREAKFAEMELLGEQTGTTGAQLNLGQEINSLTSQITVLEKDTPVFWEDVKHGDTKAPGSSSTTAHAFTPTCARTVENSDYELEALLVGVASSVGTLTGMEDALYYDSYVDATVTRDNKEGKKRRLQELAAQALLKKIRDAYRGVKFTTLDILKELLARLNRNNKEPNRDPNQNPNNSRECQSQLMRYSWLRVNMPNEFSYTGVVQLNSAVQGLYHSFIRHIVDWSDVTPIDGTLIQRLSPLMREIVAVSGATNDAVAAEQRKEFVKARQALSQRQYDDVQSALVEIQMTLHHYIQRNITMNNFLGRSVNANGHEQLFFKVKNTQGKDVVMCVCMSDETFVPEESNGRPLRIIVTVFFMPWEKYLRRGVVETKEEMMQKKNK